MRTKNQKNKQKYPLGQDYFMQNSLFGIECALSCKNNKR